MVLISFDIEEFDAPDEFGAPIPFDQQIEISRRGCHAVLDLLKRKKVSATFYSTVAFAREVPEVIERIITEGHELASHGMEHSRFAPTDLQASRQALEALSGGRCRVLGFRMPRMQAVSDTDLLEAGYLYDASLHPTWIPSRYCHLHEPRKPHRRGELWELPTSVTPTLRLPLFWLALHHYPTLLYRWLCRHTYRRTGYFSLYFHPWEFVDLCHEAGVSLPSHMTRNSGTPALRRLEHLIDDLQELGANFVQSHEAIRT